jgi:hypothetical protein
MITIQKTNKKNYEAQSPTNSMVEDEFEKILKKNPSKLGSTRKNHKFDHDTEITTYEANKKKYYLAHCKPRVIQNYRKF